MNKLKIFADNLFVHETLHFSSGIAMFFLINSFFGKPILGIIAFLVSLFIDADHYLEGLVYNHFKIGWIFTTYPHIYWRKTGKITILLHSWELLVLIMIFGKIFNFLPLAVAIVLPAMLHYLIDTIVYCSFKKLPLLQYFLIYRIFNRFDLNKAKGCTDIRY